MERKLSHEQIMEKTWKLIDELSITEDSAVYKQDPDAYYLVSDIYKVRDAFYSDMENGISFNGEDADLPSFFDRHRIEYQ
jgi:hypothetical protein